MRLLIIKEDLVEEKVCRVLYQLNDTQSQIQITFLMSLLDDHNKKNNSDGFHIPFDFMRNERRFLRILIDRFRIN